MVKLRVNVPIRALTAGVQEVLIAPKITRIDNPAIPDLSGSKRYPVNVFISNFLTAFGLPNFGRQMVFNYVRRAEDALDEYLMAREQLLRFVNSGADSPITPYLSALRHFEQCIAHLDHGFNYAFQLTGEWGYQRGDGSRMSRIDHLHNWIKHTDGRMGNVETRHQATLETMSYQKLDHEQPQEHLIARTSNVPVWLTSDGLESRDTQIAYHELADEIEEYMEDACKIARMSLKPEDKPPGS